MALALGALLVATTAFITALTATTRLEMREVCHVLTVALLAGIGAAVASGHLFFLHLEFRQDLIVPASLIWGGVAGIGGLSIWLLAQSKNTRTAIRAGLSCLLVIAPLAVAWGAPTLAAPERDSKGPSLLLVTCDSLRADYCSAYGGSAATPTLEALAKRGALFQRSYSLAPWTLPSMSAMFSSGFPAGLSPSASRNEWIRDMRRYIVTPSTPVLAEQLQERGHATCAFTGNKLLYQPKGIMRGFDYTGVFRSARPETRSVFAQFPVFAGHVGQALAGRCARAARRHDQSIDATRANFLAATPQCELLSLGSLHGSSFAV